jgi:hypothetical protein
MPQRPRPGAGAGAPPAPPLDSDHVESTSTSAQRQALESRGWAVQPAALPILLLEALRADLDFAYERCRAIQVRNGLGDGTVGTAHHLPLFERSFLALLDEMPWELPRAWFEGPLILNSFGAVLNLPGSEAYVGRPHRDLRTFSGPLHLMMNVMVLLDEFTLENGATYLLSGSHRAAERPPDEVFFAEAARLVAPAGSVVYFDSNLWHAAGANTTRLPRRVLTLTLTRPFVKQQLDYPRALAALENAFSENSRQILGFHARVPQNLDEWYQPPEKRLYRPGQG